MTASTTEHAHPKRVAGGAPEPHPFAPSAPTEHADRGSPALNPSRRSALRPARLAFFASGAPIPAQPDHWQRAVVSLGSPARCNALGRFLPVLGRALRRPVLLGVNK